jgi:copper transport protein
VHLLARAIVFIGVFLITSVPAAAHAVLERSAPAAGERLERAPQLVVLTFDDPVETALGSLRVLDATGAVRSIGPVVHPNGDPTRVAVRVGTLRRGRYVVVWSVVSDDAHLVDGAYAFGVGVPAGPPPPQPGTGGGAVLLSIIHFGMLAGIILGIGLPIGAATVGRRAPPAPSFVEFGAWFVLAFCAFADVASRAVLAGGSLGDALTTHAGALRLVTAGAAVAGIVAVSRRQRWWGLLIAASAVATLSLSMAGHAAETAPALLGVIADALHLVAAAAWIGVLAIATTLEPTEHLRAVSRFATAAVGTIVITGVIQTFRNVGSLAALVTTTYGREIDCKVILMVAALGVALASRRALRHAQFGIRGRLRLELCLLTAVIAVTAVLVESPLPE